MPSPHTGSWALERMQLLTQYRTVHAAAPPGIAKARRTDQGELKAWLYVEATSTVAQTWVRSPVQPSHPLAHAHVQASPPTTAAATSTSVTLCVPCCNLCAALLRRLAAPVATPPLAAAAAAATPPAVPVATVPVTVPLAPIAAVPAVAAVAPACGRRRGGMARHQRSAWDVGYTAHVAPSAARAR